MSMSTRKKLPALLQLFRKVMLFAPLIFVAVYIPQEESQEKGHRVFLKL